MQTFLIRLACRSPYLTPWRNCTLWGRLSWIVATGGLEGWDIDTWADCYREGMPPLVVGDGFPAGAVPVPAIFLATATEKRSKTLPWEDWKRLCATGDWPSKANGRHAARVERMHVVMRRDSATALEGGLRTEIGEQPEELLIVAQIDDLLGIQGLETLMKVLCYEGWGQGRTNGYGHIKLLSIEPVQVAETTGCVATLGHCHPTDDLPEDGWWRWGGVPARPHDKDTRRGPHQYFTTMLQPGASFQGVTGGAIGRVIEWPQRTNYQHYGVAPLWPVVCGIWAL